MAHYSKGLLAAFLLFGLAFVAIQLVGSAMTGRPVRWISVIDTWLYLGLPVLAVLAVCIGPVVLGIRRTAKGTLSLRGAALIGAVLSPASISTIWLLFREENETVGGLLTLWARVPREPIGFIPYMVASVFFASWLVARHKSGQLPA